MQNNIIKALACVAVFVVAACEAKAPVRPDFREALDAHLAAITSKDLEAYKQTITSDDDLMIIFPEGEVIETTEGVIAFHEEWFADEDWRFEPEIIKTIIGGDMATAVLKYQYRDTPDGEPRSSWLVLVFELEDGAWRLVHDQNTRIKASAEEGQE